MMARPKLEGRIARQPGVGPTAESNEVGDQGEWMDDEANPYLVDEPLD